MDSKHSIRTGVSGVTKMKERVEWRWWLLSDPTSGPSVARDAYGTYLRMGPREKLWSARFIARKAQEDWENGDYCYYNERMAESRSLEEWAQRELDKGL